MIWQTSRFVIDLSRPQIMGIVNVTPDSFSDGGHHGSTLAALRHCEQLLQDGADILDIGGESTRPGSPAVPLDEEIARVVPLVRNAVSLGVPISVDTYKPKVMQAVLDLGADIVNDIWALRQPGAVAAVAAHPRCGVCLMHMHRDPQTMQAAPMEGDVVAQVLSFLQLSAQNLLAAGVHKDRIVVDPGIGFGKTVAQNFALLAHQQRLRDAGHAVLAGWSRKSSLGAVTDLPVDQRMVPSVAAAVLAVERGASVVRVHDVRDTASALKVWSACHAASRGPMQ
ncbi:dihydropteroate synthase [Acidovorax sp. Leaf76]|uniref:dihydropteroate synthase n=1 Tax=unclassified Acidovorax TaxID=2684926 RepID=UPI0006FCE282|nr:MULTISPECIES: dihydropteroate synthase [unclassified Acidovorax]KQO24373.1 dihydropteroate synthase [Acidovorax sp. Leaf76]KQO39400.1 dihydropteroate synthase [Acidovorax sp. Leaf84]KQS24565.1 dihydropteroate synthase [Acidovorax sp. Leaf191]